MVAEIKMPQVSDNPEPVTIIGWKQHEGAAVNQGDLLAEVETDKATLEIASTQAGTLLKILVPAGASARAGEIIAYIGEAGEQALVPPRPVNGKAAADAEAQAGRVRVSPLARRMAGEYGLELSGLQGSGPEGRIVKKDVEEAVAKQSISAPPAGRAPAPQPAQQSVDGELVPFTKMRATIARRMQQSVNEAPHFHTTAAISMDQAQELRDGLRKKPEFKGLSVNHLIVKAAAYALVKEPRVNRAARGDKVLVPKHINIGIVTAVEDGLLIPVVKDADRLSLQRVVAEARLVVERAKSGKPLAGDLVGATFSISNVGMYDIENFTAIISPGQGAILSVSAIREEPVVRNGRIVIGQMMRVTLAVDHRVIDGVMSCIFLQHFKEALEMPALLLL